MAKTRGPLFSVSAHGTIGKALTYALRKSRNVVRFQHAQADYVNLARLISRNHFKEAAYTWGLLTAEQKQGWKALTTYRLPTAWNVYLSRYIKSIRTGVPCQKLADGTTWLGHSEVYTIGADLEEIFQIVDDGIYFWLSKFSSPTGVYRVLKSDPTDRVTILYGSDIGRSTGVVDDGEYIWSIAMGSPSRLFRFIKSSLVSAGDWSLGAGSNNARAIIDDGVYLWVACNISPASIVRILKSNPLTYDVYNVAVGSTSVYSLVLDGLYLYAGFNNTTGRFARLLLSDLTIQDNYELGVDTGRIHSLSVNGSNLYASLFNSPGNIAIIPIIDPTTWSVYVASGVGQVPRSISCDGTYALLGCDSTPGCYVKFWL